MFCGGGLGTNSQASMESDEPSQVCGGVMGIGGCGDRWLSMLEGGYTCIMNSLRVVGSKLLPGLCFDVFDL
jgi:hypothetical protein